jgi:MYXO-CTERM domain-containing protein
VKSIAIAAVTVALVGSASISRALAIEACCACVELSSGTNQTASPAAFCAGATDSSEASSLGDRCVALGPEFRFICIPPGMPTCTELLAAEGIACPTSPAPAAGPLNLATLALVLGAFGALAARRRRGREL